MYWVVQLHPYTLASFLALSFADSVFTMVTVICTTPRKARNMPQPHITQIKLAKWGLNRECNAWWRRNCLKQHRLPFIKKVGASVLHLFSALCNRSCSFLTYDPTVFALKCGAGACDGPTGAGAAERRAAGGAVEGWTWAVSAGWCCAAGQCRAGADTLAGRRGLGKTEREKV